MEKNEIIENFKDLKLTMKTAFPAGKWQTSNNQDIIGIFEVKFGGDKKPEKMTVYHSGKINFQGGHQNGARLENHYLTISAKDLLSSQESGFGANIRAENLERERQICFKQNLPNAAALLMKAILEDLWKQAFGNTGFAEQQMKRAIEGENDITAQHLATWRRIRDYGNGVTHEPAWDANMEHISDIEIRYGQLVSALLHVKKRQN